MNYKTKKNVVQLVLLKRGVILLNDLFVIFGSLFALSVLFGNLFIFRLKNEILISNYITAIRCFLFLYSLFAFLLMFRVPHPAFKILMLFFAASPYLTLLGKAANYYDQKIYSLMHIVFAVISVIFVIWYL